jgi:hypothetical protein
LHLSQIFLTDALTFMIFSFVTRLAKDATAVASLASSFLDSAKWRGIIALSST